MVRHYFAVAFRNLRGAPLASAINVITLAVGLVCFVTAYAFVHFWGTAEQYFPKAADIYVLTATVKNKDNGSGLTNLPRAPEPAAENLRADYPKIKVSQALVIDRATMVASGPNAVRLFGVAVDPEFLEMFDLPFVAGDSGSVLAAPRSVILTRDAAGRLFGADNPIGKSVVIGNKVDATVTGVIDAIPEPSHFGRSASASLSFDLLASRDVLEAVRGRPFGGGSWFQFGNAITYLYLPASGGVSAASMAAQLQSFAGRHVPADLLKTNDYTFGLVPVGKLLSGTDDFFDTGLSFESVLLLLGGLVLGVACVNYANLATARAARRVREIGVRKAIGAAPRQVAAQSLFEAGLLVAASLVLALAAFVVLQPLVKALLGAEVDTTFFGSLEVWPALAGLAAAVTLAAGAYPAFALSRVRPVIALATAQARLGSPLFSTLLVGGQFAIASFLLITVTVIALQNADMRRTALRAIPDPLLIIENAPRTTNVTMQTLRERLESLPQVRGVTEVQGTPWESLMMTTVTEDPNPQGPGKTVVTRPVGFDFFDVFDVALVAGRVFDREHGEDLPRPPPATPAAPAANSGQPAPAGAAPPSPPEPPQPVNIVVDTAFVAGLGLTPEQAIDKLLYRPAPPIPGAAAQARPLRIVGVVQERVFSFFKAPVTTAGAMYTLSNDLGLTVARFRAVDVDAALTGIDRTWKELAPNVAIRRRFLDEVFESSYAQYERISRLFTTLSVTAFAICIAGLFGMATFVAGRRRREIGVRKTLGGSTSQMIRLLLASFSWPVLAANLLAWPAAYFAARAYLNQFGQSIALTPWPFVASVATTVLIAWVAVAGQTLRAARTTPAEVLRHD
ncbi:MAG TPA: FtsX-like permease family protein [Gammaproteobacteria bacterium]|nr:FtsX-like permease family protein [Gammaproteobacteria bacterium]